MRYYEEIPIEDFPFWSGAQDVAYRIIEQPNAKEIWEWLESYLSDCGELSSTQVNDFFWFDAWDLLTDEGLVKDDEDDDND